MSLNQSNYSKLLKLCEYMSNPCIVFPQGHHEVHFDSLQDLVNKILDHSIYTYISEFDTYFIDFIGVQQSLLSDDESIVIVYMV